MYKLNEKDIRHDPERNGILFIDLPIVGEIPVKAIIDGEEKIEDKISNLRCSFLHIDKLFVPIVDDDDEPGLFLAGRFLGFLASGNAIITMHQMGYDLTVVDVIKKVFKSDREKLLNEYKRLLIEQPELFGWRPTLDSIIDVLEENSGKKITVSDIAKMTNTDEEGILSYTANVLGIGLDSQSIGVGCELLYKNDKIQFAGNGRYYIEDSDIEKQSGNEKSEEVDVEKELEKYKGLLDKGIITQEEYDAKRKQILGL